MLRWRKQDIAPAKGAASAAAAKLNNDHQQSFFAVSSLSDWYVRPAMILTAFALFCGLLFNAAGHLYQWLNQPVTALEVKGNTQYLDSHKMLTKLARNLQGSASKPSILSVDIQEVQKLAQEEPWINAVHLKRRWPQGLEIEVREQVPIAKWGDKGLLNHQGDIFWPDNKQGLEHLPILNGPSTDTARVMEQYHSLSHFFKGSNTLMAGLTLQARGAWTLLLDNNIEVELGREQILARLRRFIELYKGHLYAKADNIERVDVRYTNGVSVKWLDTVAPIGDQLDEK